MFNWGKKSVKRYEGVNPLLIKCATLALAISKYDMTIPWMGGVRTAADQNELFKAGNSKADGYDKKSYHQSGNALDVIAVGPNPYENHKAFNHFAKLMFRMWQEMIYKGEATGYLYWGGHFGKTGWDRPHWQIVLS